MFSSPMEMDTQLPNGGNSGAPAHRNFAVELGETGGVSKRGLRHHFLGLRVPFEHYKKTIGANHRAVEKEVSAIISSVSDASDSDLSQDDAGLQLNSLVSRLQGLKRKEEITYLEKTEAIRELTSSSSCFSDLSLALQAAGRLFFAAINFDESKSDSVFGPKAEQKDLYDQAVIPTMHAVLEGFNCTIFADGRTGTEKTYTMEG